MAQLMWGIKRKLLGSFPHRGIPKEITILQNHHFLQEKAKQNKKTRDNSLPVTPEAELEQEQGQPRAWLAQSRAGQLKEVGQLPVSQGNEDPSPQSQQSAHRSFHAAD